MAPHIRSDAPWHPAGPHLQPLGIHSLANVGGWSHRLNAARCDGLELLQPTAQSCAQTGARLLPVWAALHRGSTEGLHRVGAADTERRCLMRRDGQCNENTGPPSLGGPAGLLDTNHHVVVAVPYTARALGRLHPALLSNSPLLLPHCLCPLHFTPSEDLPLHRDGRGQPTAFSAPTASLCQGHLPSPHPPCLFHTVTFL